MIIVFLMFCFVSQSVFATSVRYDQTIGYRVDPKGQMILDEEELAAIIQSYHLGEERKVFYSDQIKKENVKKSSNSDKYIFAFLFVYWLVLG